MRFLRRKGSVEQQAPPPPAPPPPPRPSYESKSTETVETMERRVDSLMHGEARESLMARYEEKWGEKLDVPPLTSGLSAYGESARMGELAPPMSGGASMALRHHVSATPVADHEEEKPAVPAPVGPHEAAPLAEPPAPVHEERHPVEPPVEPVPQAASAGPSLPPVPAGEITGGMVARCLLLNFKCLPLWGLFKHKGWAPRSGAKRYLVLIVCLAVGDAGVWVLTLLPKVVCNIVYFIVNRMKSRKAGRGEAKKAPA